MIPCSVRALCCSVTTRHQYLYLATCFVFLVPDAAYLNHPVHLLTGCALILGVVESLVLTMKAEAAENLKLHATGRAPRTKRRQAECTCAKLQKRARKAVRYVEQDLRELLDVPQVRSFVRRWSWCCNRRIYVTGIMGQMHELVRAGSRKLNGVRMLECFPSLRVLGRCSLIV